MHLLQVPKFSYLHVAYLPCLWGFQFQSTQVKVRPPTFGVSVELLLFHITPRSLCLWFYEPSYRSADKSLARPRRKQATSMFKSLRKMDPTRSREIPSCPAIDLAEIRRSSKISSWILSIASGVVGLRTFQHPGITSFTVSVSPWISLDADSKYQKKGHCLFCFSNELAFWIHGIGSR
jgi:hypothetical protein